MRSPHPHARIKSINTAGPDPAWGQSGGNLQGPPKVSGKVVDIGEGAMFNLGFLSDNCLAPDKVLYKGHAVAAVAATSPHEAEEALALIDVEYEVLTPVMDVLDAMNEDAPVLHDRLESNRSVAWGLVA